MSVTTRDISLVGDTTCLPAGRLELVKRCFCFYFNFTCLFCLLLPVCYLIAFVFLFFGGIFLQDFRDLLWQADRYR